jgi:glycosyltransferase involved in cell wall biosynthesis
MSRSSVPLISVCIPAYNNEAFIGAAIESVLNQTFADFELVVVDDRSTDETLERIRAFRDPRIRIVENERNLGHEGNWNKALREGRGRFVKILPGDDLLRPRCLERQLAAFEDPAAEMVALVACTRDIIDAKGRKIMRRRYPGAGGPIPGLEAVRRCVRAGTNLIGEPAAVLMRAGLISRAGAFDGTNLYVIDLDFWARLLLQGSLFVIHEPHCGFRISRTAASTRIRSSQSRDFRLWIERLGRDPRFGLARGDLRWGKFRAAANEMMRRMIYGLILPRRFASTQRHRTSPKKF